jgi:hypothetical protein
VAPIVYRECVGCHREGGIAPFSLTEYPLASLAATAMAEATAAREMPPMPVDNSGSCNTYSNARWLTDAEIATFAAWVLARTPEGDPSRAPPLPPAPAGLERVDVTLDPGASYSPNNELSDDYRCFVVDPQIDDDAFVVAYDVIPGDPRIVHHAIVYGPRTDEAAFDAELLDAAEDGLGYTCFGASGVAADPIAIWAPGGSVTRFPTDTGLPIFPRKLVLQVHYNVAAGVFPDRTVVQFQTQPTIARPGSWVPIANLDLNVAPGLTEAVSTRTYTLDEPARTGIVHGVAPHMHTLGKTLRLDAHAPGRDTCLVNVNHWHFHWQNSWWYEVPLNGAGTTGFTLSCGYDTSDRTEPVTWGEGTMDEMCLVYMYVTY